MVNINGRNDFTASGNYYYKMNNGTTETIKIDEIKVNNPYKGLTAPEGKKTKKMGKQRFEQNLYLF